MYNPINKQLTFNQAIYKQPVQITLHDIINKNLNNNENFNTNSLSHIDKNINSSNKILEINNNINNDFSSSSSDSTYSTELIHSDNAKNNINNNNNYNFIDNESDNDNKSDNDNESDNDESIIDTDSSYQEYNDSENETESEKSEITETKLYWQYGNSGLKIINFKRLMSKNLSIMYHIDNLFLEYKSINNLNNYNDLFNKKTNKKYELKKGSIKTSNGDVSVNINHEKIKGKFKVLSAEYITLSDIEITQKELKKKSIPNLNSLLKHKDNIFHITKIMKTLTLTKKMRIKYDSINHNTTNHNTNINDISKNANEYLENLIKNNNKNKILKSNKYSAFYIKIFNDKGKSFYIDEKKNIIHYIATDINFNNYSINLRYYTFNILAGKIENI
jgi:hypothetical protein